MPSDTAAQHDLTVSLEPLGFRLVCSCGWVVAGLPSLGGGPIFCPLEVLTRGR